jgi:hypothetical protein
LPFELFEHKASAPLELSGGWPLSAEESLGRAEELLARLEAARGELQRATEADDVDAAIEVLTELADLARQVEEELARARREAEGS